MRFLFASFFLSYHLLFQGIASEELTDEILPRTEASVLNEFYQLLDVVDSILQQNRIPYWAVAGTLLGAVRHHAMIPWDDDIDLGCFSDDLAKLISLRPQFQDKGLEICVLRDYIKIFPKNGTPIQKEEGQPYLWKYPFIDIFFYTIEEEKLVHASVRLKEGFGDKEWLNKEDVLLPLSKTDFGPTSIFLPNNSKSYLTRLYGDDCFDFAYCDYDHAKERKRERIKVRLRKEALDFFEDVLR